ncbi:MAG TPA: S1C family serine protease [Alphaproteobacteria bacterium]|nr:S1C family serine protease [Alphaproteobacteria bacterium]
MLQPILSPRWCAIALAAAAFLAAEPTPAPAQNIQEQLSAVVRVRTVVPGDARTAEALGRSREGNGVVIDQAGLVVTIGYLMVEATGVEVMSSDGRSVPAQAIGYDHESGFGLLRTLAPLMVKPLAFGRSADLKAQDPVLIAGFGGPAAAAPGFVVTRREFAGSWEYLLDDAIFTAPPYLNWSGAALIDRTGRLVGIGSLIVGDTTGGAAAIPGNMFVPIDRLKPILADLIAEGQSSAPPAPWLGLAAEEVQGRLLVVRVTPEGPAAKAGVRPGDIITGIGNDTPRGLADYYRKMRARGPAGTAVPLTLQQGGEQRSITIVSDDRRKHLKLKSSF